VDTTDKKQEEKIDVKIVSKEEKKWIDLKEKVIQAIDIANMDILVNKKILELCNDELKQLQK
jgi:hypothetical protein